MKPLPYAQLVGQINLLTNDQDRVDMMEKLTTRVASLDPESYALTIATFDTDLRSEIEIKRSSFSPEFWSELALDKKYVTTSVTIRRFS